MTLNHFEVDVGLFGRKVVGDYAVYDNSRLFRAGTFPNRIVNGKPLIITNDHLKSVVDKFRGPIGGNIQHSNFLKGEAAHVMSVSQLGNELRGTIAIPIWLDEHLDEDHKKLSIELDPTTFDNMIGLALCTNPQITDAQLMTYFQDFKKQPHTTYHGQSSIQQIHDQAARSGAICNPPPDKDTEDGKMVSKKESKGFQALHDLSLEHGASCDGMGYGYYTETEQQSDIPLEGTTLPVQTTYDTPMVNTHLEDSSAHRTARTQEKDKPMLTWTDIKNSLSGLFAKEGITVEPETYTDPSGVVHTFSTPATTPGVETVDVTKSAEFIAKDDEAKALKVKLGEFETAKNLQFTKDNETAIDALITVGKFDPKDREKLLADRAQNFTLFDELAALLPIKPEYVPAGMGTKTADEVRDEMDKFRPESSKLLENNKSYLANHGVGL